MGLRMTNTVCPASGLVPEKEELSKTRKAARGPSEAAVVAVETGGAGVTATAGTGPGADASLAADTAVGAGDE